MHKITNRTNSPFDLQGASGNVRLPAFGQVEGEFSGEYLDVLRASGAVAIEPSTQGSDQGEQSSPADETQSGDAQGAESAADALESLRAEYRELAGKDADKRWAEARIRSEIDKLKD